MLIDHSQLKVYPLQKGPDGGSPFYAQVLEIVRHLSPAEQRRRRDDLVKLANTESSAAPTEVELRPEVLASLEENADVWDELSKL